MIGLRRTVSPLVFSVVLAAQIPVSAGVMFIGAVTIPGSGTDKSGLPNTLLEDGKSTQAGLTGFGSGLAYAGNGVFYALNDRGPNKVVYNPSVDNTTSFNSRYQQFQITATPKAGTLQPDGTYSAYDIQATNIGTTLLKNIDGKQYVGISTGFSTNPAVEGTRLDAEGIAVAPDGSVWISDEYGPYILHFDKNGNEIGSLALPPGFQVANPKANLADETNPANNTIGRFTNRGAEGLAISPDGKTLAVVMQSSLIQDGGLSGVNDRILIYDLEHPNAPPQQFLYQLDSTATPLSDITAINNHQFLVDERDGVGGAAGIKKLYLIDLNQSSPPTDLTATAYSGSTAANGLPATGTPAGVTPLDKTLFANIGALLNAANPFSGVNGTNGLPDKIEGYAWGPDLADGRHLLLVTNDNDFAHPAPNAVTGYPNYIFAFAVDPSDVPGFQAAFAAPEPASLAIWGIGAIGLLSLRRRSRSAAAR